MKEFELKYGCNPNQKPARIYMENGAELPIEVLNGRPGYINFLDAFNGWQLVKELKAGYRLPCRHKLQACFTGRRRYRSPADRYPRRRSTGSTTSASFPLLHALTQEPGAPTE